MKRLRVWIVVLTILFSSGITLAGQAGIGAPKPAFAQWFTYPNGKPCPMPCLFGIRPGVTKLDEIAAILNAHAFTKTWHELDFGNDDSKTFAEPDSLKSGYVIEIYKNNDGTIERICLCGIYDNLVTFEDVLYTFGFSRLISPHGYNGGWKAYFYYAGRLVMVRAEIFSDQCRIKPTLPITSLLIFSPEGYENYRNMRAIPTIVERWAGFSWRTYWTRYFPDEVSPFDDGERSCEP